MKKRKFRLKKPITELVDDTLSLISGDDKEHVNQNVRSPKTTDSKIAATTQPFSWNPPLALSVRELLLFTIFPEGVVRI